MKYLQRADSFMGICWEKTEKKWLFKRSAFCSGSVIVDPFFFSVLIPVESVYLCLITSSCLYSIFLFFLGHPTHDGQVFFRDREIFIRRVFFF